MHMNEDQKVDSLIEQAKQLGFEKVTVESEADTGWRAKAYFYEKDENPACQGADSNRLNAIRNLFYAAQVVRGQKP